MPLRIAYSGKGGSGKTTLAALTVKVLFQETGKPVLAVDADPNFTLGSYLGFTVRKTIADIREELAGGRDNLPPGLAKDRLLDYEIEMAIEEGKECDLITMGRPEGPGCYCFINNLLRRSLSTLGGKYVYLVLDNEAGMEHLSRRTTDNIDLLVMVMEPTLPGLETVVRISKLVSKLPVTVRKNIAVINKVSPGWEGSPMVSRLTSSGVVLGGMIELDPKIDRLSQEGVSLMSLGEENTTYIRLHAILEPFLKNS